MTDDTTLSADRVLEYLSVHARRAEEEGRYKEMIAMDAAAEEIGRMLSALRTIAAQTDPKWGVKIAREYVEMYSNK